MQVNEIYCYMTKYRLACSLCFSAVAPAAESLPAALCPAGCGHDYQWPDKGQGWDIAAMNDGHPEYRGSCGVCYEVKCDSKSVRDGYGEANRHRHHDKSHIQQQQPALAAADSIQSAAQDMSCFLLLRRAPCYLYRHATQLVLCAFDGQPGCLADDFAAAGESIDRNGVCKDTSASVVVKITDTCPCNYPNNYFSEWLLLLSFVNAAVVPPDSSTCRTCKCSQQSVGLL
eukprot:GHRQ01038672.1.p1 GENE.GHRQ01038672.1~~GHRQ01038672.1.p1  ORF type:complete len:229 (-),score=32.25 GHRQ01038672.1:1121-1807(-)